MLTALAVEGDFDCVTLVQRQGLLEVHGDLPPIRSFTFAALVYRAAAQLVNACARAC